MQVHMRYSNYREGDYGVDTRGRLRFAHEIVREIKREADDDLPVIFRLSSSEEMEEVYDIDYILSLLVQLEEDGVDAFHVSCGIATLPVIQPVTDCITRWG
ncbi:MAG: hypothetical protein SWK76_07120 [Actinomycetota bacterium]|nr:hypothetical protein [Actinomycetota bacterium]